MFLTVILSLLDFTWLNLRFLIKTMSSKHFYTSADGLVLKSLRGAILLNPSLRLYALITLSGVHITHRT